MSIREERILLRCSDIIQEIRENGGRKIIISYIIIYTPQNKVADIDIIDFCATPSMSEEEERDFRETFTTEFLTQDEGETNVQ